VAQDHEMMSNAPANHSIGFAGSSDIIGTLSAAELHSFKTYNSISSILMLNSYNTHNIILLTYQKNKSKTENDARTWQICCGE